MDVDDASFKTVTFSISLGFKAVKTPLEIGEPSKTNKGSVEELIEPTPRKRIETFSLGSPEEVYTCKPATCPCKASAKFALGRLEIFSDLTAATEPTIEPNFFAEP